MDKPDYRRIVKSSVLWNKLNQRRCFLIQKVDAPTKEETEELFALQTITTNLMRLAFPPPLLHIEELERLTK